MMKYTCGLLFLFILRTSYGQSQINVSKDNIKPVTEDIVTSQVPNSMVRHVRQARNGDILIASFDGVFRYDGKSFTNLTSSIPAPSFWDVLEDRKGNLWFASRDSGVYYYDEKSLPTGRADFQHFTTEDGLASDVVLHFYEDRAGNTWFGETLYDGKTFRALTTKDGFPNNHIRLLLEDKTGKLWFGVQGEDMYVYDGKTFTVLKNKDGKTFNNVWSIIEDRKGNIWFGCGGICRYDGSTITKVSEKEIYAIIEDKKGNIWATGGKALLRFEQESLYYKEPTVTEIKLLEDGMLLDIVEANDGSIWIGSMGPDHGVYRYDGKTITNFKDKVGHK